ncbi:MAG: hypothetical protein II767_09925, partial [Proteobacteria bacterium]|nr:hypothetical protein [Pseudomonadota bacterium]
LACLLAKREVCLMSCIEPIKNKSPLHILASLGIPTTGYQLLLNEQIDIVKGILQSFRMVYLVEIIDTSSVSLFFSAFMIARHAHDTQLVTS